MKVKGLLAACALTAATITSSPAHANRDYISIVGSSTVYPFATVVAEQYGRTTKFKTPKIESTGSGGGFKLFCAGVGVQHPDITNASRAIKGSEIKKCMANGVKEIIEVKIGYDGIVLANSKKTDQMQITRKDIFTALAKEVPGADGKLVANPHKTWKDVNSNLTSYYPTKKEKIEDAIFSKDNSYWTTLRDKLNYMDKHVNCELEIHI